VLWWWRRVHGSGLGEVSLACSRGEVYVSIRLELTLGWKLCHRSLFGWHFCGCFIELMSTVDANVGIC
jgi:hypothetical protein